MAPRKTASTSSRKTAAKPAKKDFTGGTIAEFSREDDLKAYREMLFIRRFEEKAGQLYGMGFIGGFCHLYIGQEAVVVGMQMALTDGDQVITGYRDHGHMLACGMSARGVMAELTGREGGYSRGKGGSMHIADFSVGMLGANGVVTAGLPIAVGAAHALKIRKTGAIAVSFFGDGAINRGPFLEALNWAQVYQLPVLFVCEDNQISATT